MALKLAEVLDLAIGVDIASVNFLHLREVLITVIERLDIGDVAVKKPKQRDADDINECEVEDSGAPLSDNVDEKRETHTGQGKSKVVAAAIQATRLKEMCCNRPNITLELFTRKTNERKLQYFRLFSHNRTNFSSC